MYKYVYKRKSDGRKVFSHIPLNYKDLEPVLRVKSGDIKEGDTLVFKKTRKKSKK